MMCISLLVFCASSLVLVMASNTHDVDLTCPHNEYLSKVTGSYLSPPPDRDYDYLCAALTTGQTNLGQWHNDVNSYKSDFEFSCPNQKVMTGVKSVYSSADKDRRFSFRCSSLQNIELGSCETTTFINQYGGSMGYTVTAGYAIVGFQSRYSHSWADRRWKVKKCPLQ